MDIVLENEFLKVGVKQKGAELATVFSHETALEYIWGADPAFWGKSSPVLFPIVGTLKDDTFIYQNKKYSLPRHGFARDQMFEVEHAEKTSAVFLLKSSTASREKYPFDFELRLKYTLDKNFVCLTYDVKNTSSETLYFSIGGHPAFKVPLTNNAQYEDYFLAFNQKETAGRWPLTAGLVKTASVPLLQNSNTLQLNRQLFADDAVVLKNLKSTVVSLTSTKDNHGLDFYFEGFPFLGIWAAPNADFVCIEPWCGIADAVTHDQTLETKEGIEKAQAGANWSRMWKVKFF